MEDKIKKGLLISLFALLLLPLLQKNFNIVESAGLFGYYTFPPEATFSFSKWWDGSFQKEEDKYRNDMFGFRTDFVRINNQLDYYAFEKLHVSHEVPGKHHNLWDFHYILAYQGADYIGYQPIKEKMVKLKRIQDTLSRLGKSLILVNTPSKGFYYPEDIPEGMSHTERGMTNFQAGLRLADSLGINQIDFNSWFMGLKNKHKEALYTKQGIHWSVYGAALAADSLVKYMERVMHIQMPELTWSVVDTCNEARGTDNDLSLPLNLIFPFHEETYLYQRIGYKNETTAQKPNVIYIGDSFMFPWIYLGIPDHIHKDWQFWYYFTTVCNRQYKHGDANQPNIQKNEWDWKAELQKADCIVLIQHAGNMHQVGCGFIDQAYEYYFGNK